MLKILLPHVLFFALGAAEGKGSTFPERKNGMSPNSKLPFPYWAIISPLLYKKR
jgi:hypothetical protein